VLGDGEAFFDGVVDDSSFISSQLFAATDALWWCSTRGGRGHARGWCSGGLGVAEKRRQTAWWNGARSRVAAEWSESVMRRNSFLHRWDAVEDKATHIGSASGRRRGGDLVWSMRSLLQRCLGARALN
jgi:hypothetical protein